MIGPHFPSTVAFWLGPWPVRWYGLAYSVAMVLAWVVCRYVVLPRLKSLSRHQLDDSVLWGMAGVVLGGRLGYVFLYAPQAFLAHPLKVFYVWEGGMAFHGGLVGVAVALGLYAWRQGISVLALWDVWACVAPLGLFWGRWGNFINQELYGKVTSLPWGVVFPRVDALPRHPTQLYEAALEGVVLGALLLVMAMRYPRLGRYPGCFTGMFLVGYGMARWWVEYLREPLETVVLGGATLPLGQLYSIPFMLLGVGLVAWAFRPKGRPRYG